jgi:hypothetical protein
MLEKEVRKAKSI